MRRVLIFGNPIAGRGRGAALAAELERELRFRGYDSQLILSQPDRQDHGFDSREVVAAVVIGGDGTLRAVADLAISSAMGGSGLTGAVQGSDLIPYPLLIVPMGTANLMGKHLGIAWSKSDPATAIARALERPKLVHLDVARTPTGILLLVAGVGYDAAVVHELARIRKGAITMATYLGPMLRTFLNYDFPPLTITADSRHVFGPAPAIAVIGNVPEYGTGFPLLPLARPDDQMLDLCVMPCSSRSGLIRLFLAAAAGQHLDEEGVIYTKAKTIQVDSPSQVPVEVDGEPAAFTPLEIDLLPGRIPFIVPQSYD